MRLLCSLRLRTGTKAIMLVETFSLVGTGSLACPRDTFHDFVVSLREMNVWEGLLYLRNIFL